MTPWIPTQKYYYLQEHSKRVGQLLESYSHWYYADRQLENFIDENRDIWSQYRRATNQTQKWRLMGLGKKSYAKKQQQYQVVKRMRKKYKDAEIFVKEFDPRLNLIDILKDFHFKNEEWLPKYKKPKQIVPPKQYDRKRHWQKFKHF